MLLLLLLFYKWVRPAYDYFDSLLTTLSCSISEYICLYEVRYFDCLSWA